MDDKVTEKIVGMLTAITEGINDLEKQVNEQFADLREDVDLLKREFLHVNKRLDVLESAINLHNDRSRQRH